MTEAQIQKRDYKWRGALVGLLVISAFNFKFVLWIFGGLATMIMSLSGLTRLYGLPYALAVVSVLFLHESGHWLWMKTLKLETKATIFIPGYGAFVALTKLPDSDAIRAWVALAGSLIGGLGSSALYATGEYTNNDWLIAAGVTGYWLNLLQLLPVKPFDGGFIVGVLSRSLLIPATFGLFLLAIALGQPILYVIALLSILSWGQEAKGVGSNESPLSAASVTRLERVAVAFAYLSLIVVLSLGHLFTLTEASDLGNH